MRGRYAHWWVCGKCAHDDCDGAMGDGRRATKLTTMAMEQRDMMTMTMATDVGVVDDDYDDDNTSWTTSDEGDNHQGRHSQLRRRQRRLRIDGNDVCASATGNDTAKYVAATCREV